MHQQLRQRMTDGGKPKKLQDNPPQCHFAQHESHICEDVNTQLTIHTFLKYITVFFSKFKIFKE